MSKRTTEDPILVLSATVLHMMLLAFETVVDSEGKQSDQSCHCYTSAKWHPMSLSVLTVNGDNVEHSLEYTIHPSAMEGGHHHVKLLW